MAIFSSFPEFLRGAQDEDVEQKKPLEVVGYGRFGISDLEERLCA